MTNPLTRLGSLWRRWPWKWPTLALLVVAIIAIGALIAQQGDQEEMPDDAEELTTVQVQRLRDLVEGSSVPKAATIEPALSAPLIARSGGRVTEIRSTLGSVVKAGSIVVAIDTGVEANPTEAQAAGLAASLGIFDQIEAATRQASDAAVQIAQLNVSQARRNEPLNEEQAALQRRLADTSVESARLAFERAQDETDPVPGLVSSADLALQAAELAQDQATLGKQLTAVQTDNTLAQAQAGLQSAEASRAQALAQLANQRQQTVTSLAVAREQVRQAQVTAPVNGEVTSLRVRIGDFVTPGQRIGEVNAREGAQVRIDVSTAVREQLRVGDTLRISAAEQDFYGDVAALANAPASGSSLWQIEIFVAQTPGLLEPGDAVTVHVPAGATQANTVLIPLDVLVVRAGGAVLFTVGADGVVREHAVSVIGYDGAFVEARVDVSDEARVVVTNNRTLREGDRVTISEG